MMRLSKKVLGSTVLTIFQFKHNYISHFKANSLKSCLKAKNLNIVPVRSISRHPIPAPPPPKEIGEFTPLSPRPPAGIEPLRPLPFAKGGRPKPTGGWLWFVPIFTFGLGTWQIKRLKWKTDLIEQIKANTTMDPIALPLDLEEVAKMEFQRVVVKGRFDHSKEIYYGPKPCIKDGDYDEQVISKTGRESHGYNLVTPFVLSDTGERILVNRGWIRTKTIKPEDRPWSKTEGEQTITGVVRLTEQVGWGPPKKSKYSVWHYRDLDDISKHTDCLPIYIDASEEHSIPKCLWAGQTRINIRNEHLNYAGTWYSLSLCTAFLCYFKYIKYR